MRLIRNLLILLLCVALVTPFDGSLAQDQEMTDEAAVSIALMPLDSRPCNTQYPALLAEAGGAALSLPPDEAMDDFLTGADTDARWTWLEEASASADQLVIFTNSLFCGGLIASRNSAAYDDVAADLERLQALCTAFKQEEGRSVTVVQVLPRLSPNQYDDDLAPYYGALTNYGKAWDEADAAGEAAPAQADGVPQAVLDEYCALHEKSADLAAALNSMAEDGTIDRLFISQDDGASACPANITFRDLSYVVADNTQLIHGVDELSMLLVSDLAADGLEATPVRLVYSDAADAERLYPYEPVSLGAMAAEKIALGGLTVDEDAADTLYVHTDTSDAAATEEAIAAAEEAGRFALADVAATNKADPALTETLLSPESLAALDAYAGWNTAGNSIGTVCAELRALAALDARWDSLSADAQQWAVTALYTFRAVRLAEDVCYMAESRNALTTAFLADGLSDATGAFVSEDARTEANARLSDTFAAYAETLAALFNGSHTLDLGSRQIGVTIADFSSSAVFPWARSFEIEVTPAMTLTLSE